MDTKIYKNIEDIVKSFKNPVTGNFFDLNKEINIIVKNANANISINIDPKNIGLFEPLKNTIKDKILNIPNVLSANIILTAERKNSDNQNNNPANTKYDIKAKSIIAIASGKGGVGKSTVSVNLAIALKELGKSVALLDADIYGPSIPRMMGIGEKPRTNENNKLIPLENYGIKCMSIGFLIDPDTPTIWRGPMIMKALEQLFLTVEWGEPDFMIVDLPPGTGDIQLTMAQKVPMKGAIIVSTPQDVALIDARKGINMFKKVNTPVLGIIENMSYFICDQCNKRHEIFSHGGARNEAKKMDCNFLGEIPLDKNLRMSSDEGMPIGIKNLNNPIVEAYKEIAKKII